MYDMLPDLRFVIVHNGAEHATELSRHRTSISATKELNRILKFKKASKEDSLAYEIIYLGERPRIMKTSL